MNKDQQERLRKCLLAIERERVELRRSGYPEKHYLASLARLETHVKMARQDIYGISKQMSLINADH